MERAGRAVKGARLWGPLLGNRVGGCFGSGSGGARGGGLLCVVFRVVSVLFRVYCFVAACSGFLFVVSPVTRFLVWVCFLWFCLYVSLIWGFFGVRVYGGVLFTSLFCVGNSGSLSFFCRSGCGGILRERRGWGVLKEAPPGFLSDGAVIRQLVSRCREVRTPSFLV
jgi:hypothetical protein